MNACQTEDQPKTLALAASIALPVRKLVVKIYLLYLNAFTILRAVAVVKTVRRRTAIWL